MHPYNKTKRFTSSLWHWVANTLGVVTYGDESLQVSLSGTGTLSILCPREFAQCCSAAGTQRVGILTAHSRVPRGLTATDHEPSDSWKYHHRPETGEPGTSEVGLTPVYVVQANKLPTMSLHLAWEKVGNISRPSSLSFTLSRAFNKKIKIIKKKQTCSSCH